jgi:hypothetical protein
LNEIAVYLHKFSFEYVDLPRFCCSLKSQTINTLSRFHLSLSSGSIVTDAGDDTISLDPGHSGRYGRVWHSWSILPVLRRDPPRSPRKPSSAAGCGRCEFQTFCRTSAGPLGRCSHDMKYLDTRRNKRNHGFRERSRVTWSLTKRV